MKKITSVLLIVVIIGISVTSFASMEDKLGSHWSKAYIEKEFLSYYFPYLAKDNFSRFNPNGDITKQDFAMSLASLFKDYDLDSTASSIGVESSLTRKELVDIVGEKLKELDFPVKNRELPFKDINTMGSDSIELLKIVYDLEIIYGVSETSFAPNNKLSQAEAIIILQRLKGALENMQKIPFDTKGVVQTYNNQESLIVKDLNDKVTLTITKEFPTPGYSLSVKRIINTKDGYKVFLDSTPPKEGMMQLQVITYKTITVEIDKKALIKPAPYTFIVAGDSFPSRLENK
jgi:acyl carrier protein